MSIEALPEMQAAKMMQFIAKIVAVCSQLNAPTARIANAVFSSSQIVTRASYKAVMNAIDLYLTDEYL